MPELDLARHPHRRRNALTGEWVLVSPHRTERPWQGQVEPLPEDALPEYDPACYLCPGNARAGGVTNPRYTGTFVFENDFAALRHDTPDGTMSLDPHGLVHAEGVPGLCRVVCYSPRHDLTLSRMDADAIRAIVDLWADEARALGARPGIRYVQVFENRGAMMGCSNPHPHGQIWASGDLPTEVAKEARTQAGWLRGHGGCLLCDYLAFERADGERVVVENDTWTALVPFWAVWPFETLLLPRTHGADLDALAGEARDGLADLLRRLTTAYDALFGVPFPYSMGLHPRPCDGQPHDGWHLHLHFYPPLLRSATVRKFMVGYEMLATPQRDLTPEAAASRLRAVAGTP